MKFVVINKKRLLSSTILPSPSPVEPSISSQYSAICYDLLNNVTTHSAALQGITQLIKKITILPSHSSKYGNLMRAMYGLALDLCKETGSELYSEMAREAISLDSEDYSLRVHLRDSYSGSSLRLRIWSAEWVEMHPKAIPFDHALHQSLLSLIMPETTRATKSNNPFDKAVHLLLNSFSLKPAPFSKRQYEEYELELQASNWNELISRTVDTVEKAQSEVFTRGIRVSAYEQPQSQATNTQRNADSQRASKRIKTANGVVEVKKKMDRDALMRVLGVEDQFIRDIEEITPTTVPKECKDKEFEVPEYFTNVTELIIWELEGLISNNYQVPEQTLSRFRDICLKLDQSVYPTSEFYVEVLLFFAERLKENDQELEILQNTQGVKRESRIVSILARKAELEGDLIRAQELWTEVHCEESEFALRVLSVRRAIVDKTAVEITDEIPPELKFDYYMSQNDCNSAFNVFVANPFLFTPERLSLLNSLTAPQAQFLFIWCWKNFTESQNRGCILNALHQIPLNEPRTILEWVEQPDEDLIRHLIDTSTELELVYTCWASLYGLPPMLNFTETLFINCDAQPVMTLKDWVKISKLCIAIYDDERTETDIHPVTWDRLLTYAVSLKFPSKNLILNRERLKAYLHSPLFSPPPKYVKLREEETLFVKVQLLQINQVMHSTDLIKRKVLVGKNADAAIRQLRRSLKVCVTDGSCFDLLGTVYKEHAGRLLLGTHTEVLKHRPLILRLLNKSLKLFLHSKKHNRFELMGEVLRWMKEINLESINTSLFSGLKEDSSKSVSVDRLQFTIAKASIAHRTHSPLTLITLGKLCPDDPIKLKFFEKAWMLSKKSKQFQYFAAYELIEMAYQLKRDDIITLYFPDACHKDEDEQEQLDIVSIDTITPFIEAMNLIETFDTQSTQHLHTFFLATHSTNQSPLEIINTYWSRLFPMLKKPKTPSWHSVYLNEQDSPSHYASCLSLYLSSLLSFLNQHQHQMGIDKTKELLMIVIDKLRQTVGEFPRWKEMGMQAIEVYDELTGEKGEFKAYKKGLTGAKRSVAELQRLLNK